MVVVHGWIDVAHEWMDGMVHRVKVANNSELLLLLLLLLSLLFMLMISNDDEYLVRQKRGFLRVLSEQRTPYMWQR